MRYLSVVVLIRDEESYLPEWMAYHRLLGVEHFFVYDNGSAVPLSRTLAQEVDAGRVTVIDFPKPLGTVGQRFAFNDFITRFKKETRWAAFIDPDEFLVPSKEDWMPDLLSEFEEFGGLVVNWAMFGPDGHEERPEGLQIENFLSRFKDNDKAHRFVKSIIQPERAEKCEEPHSFVYLDSFFAVNGSGKKVCGRYSDPDFTRIKLHHYSTRSRKEYGEKLARWKTDKNYRINWDGFERVAKFSRVRDESILRFVPRLKRVLQG